MKTFDITKPIKLDGSLSCLDALDILTYRLRDKNCCGLFGVYLDLESHIYYFKFLNLLNKIPFGAEVIRDSQDNLTISWENNCYSFNLNELRSLLN